VVFGVWMVDIALVVGVGVVVVVAVAVVVVAGPWVSIPLKCCRYPHLVVRAFRGVVVASAVSTGRVVLQGFLLHGTLLRVPLQYRGGSRIGHPDGP